MSAVEEKLLQMGLELPDPPQTGGGLRAVHAGRKPPLVSGQVPAREWRIEVPGPSRKRVDPGRWRSGGPALCFERAQRGEEGAGEPRPDSPHRQSHRLRVERCWFNDQPKVLDGASLLLNHLLGNRGQHARAAVGVNELPLNVAVEVEMIVETES